MIDRRILPFLIGAIFISTVSYAQKSAPTTQEKIDAIQHEIDRRRPSDHAAADLLAKDLRQVSDLLKGKPAPQAAAELRVVVIHAAEKWPQHQIVEVAATDRSVILALAGDDTVHWEIKLDDGAKLQRVLLGGIEDQKLFWTNPAQAVPVEMHIVSAHQPGAFAANEPFESHHPNLRTALKNLTGMEVMSLREVGQGTGGPYVVGNDTWAWYAQIADEQLDPLYLEATALDRAAAPVQMLTQIFSAVYFSSDAPPRIAPNGRQLPPLPLELQPGMLADFTQDGPIKDSMQPLPDRVSQIAIDPRGPVMYGLGFQSIVRIDNGKAVPMMVKGDVPQLSWPCALTFDTKRQRLILTSLGGIGYMYAYSPQKDEWTYINDMNNVDLMSVTYFAKDDCLYGLAQSFGGEMGKLKILQYDADGKLVRSIDVDKSVASTHDPMHGGEIELAGDNLAIVMPPTRVGRDYKPGMCIIVDPQTGRVMSSHAMKPHSKPTDLTAGEADRLWRLLGSENAGEAKDAADRLIDSNDQAVAALSPRLSPLPQPFTADQIKHLLDQLASVDEQEREHATADLVQAGPDIQQPLNEALNQQLPPESQSRIGLILHDISKPNGRQAMVVHVLAEIGTANAIQQLIKLSPTDPDARTALRGL